MECQRVTTLFLDIGNVILTNGWDRHMRTDAAASFSLDHDEMDERHHLTFDTYEEGKLSLDEYLDRVVFHKKRPFTKDDFKDFMFARSRPFPEMIDLICRLKARYHLKVAVVSNEGRELTEYRIAKFRLADFIDFFISSCFVHYRKPDADIYRIALDIAQVAPDCVAYVEDRVMFVDVARGLGIRGIVHRTFESTRNELAAMGLVLDGLHPGEHR
jgi:putative hydrolase of the HAD superfamily